MKRRHWIFIVSLSLLLSGCGKADSYLSAKMQEKAGIESEESYVKYQEYVAQGKIDEEGLYKDEISSTEDMSNYVHITLGTNKKNLDVTYYLDKELQNLIDADEVYIKPGDALYAKVAVSDEVYTSTYGFSMFRIYEWDESNSRKESALVSDFINTGEVVRIPSDFEKKELSVEPIGLYQERQIHFSDYLLEDETNKQELTGKWIVNDKEYAGDTANISPIASYIISYEYDSNEYFFISSTPECFYNNNDDGVVIFKQKEATDRTEDYSVELHRYIDVTLVSDKDRTVAINGSSVESIKANNEIEVPRLKYGDYVTIETDKEWEDLETNRNIILTNSERVGTQYKYTLVVPQKGAEFIFDPNEYKYEHGNIVFKCFGSVVNDVQYLAAKSKIYYEVDKDSVESGYWLPEGEHCIIVEDEESTRRALNDIHFTQMVQVEVSLPQPEAGGKIIYTADGKRITDSVYKSYSGTDIMMDFEEWEGWKCNYTDGATYSVNENKKQTISVNGTQVKDVFVEDDGHKPQLTVVLDKSVGEDMAFYVTASGQTPDEQANKYVRALYRSDYKLIDSVKIGTEMPIELSMKNRAIQSGKAVRIIITKEDSSKNKTTEKRYVVDLSKHQDPIYIYTPTELGKSKTWYKSVNISIAVVDINTFSKPTVGANSSIAVRNADTMTVYNAGDYIEANQEVSFTISPSAGYYISGKGTSRDQYQEKMKYSDFVKKIGGIIEKHPALKIYSVTLDKSDTYAKYIYKLDGKEVSGTISVRDDQKLELTYEIVGDGYKLESKAGGFLGIGASDKKVTKSITISASVDGKTITKSDFEIKTVKGE